MQDPSKLLHHLHYAVRNGNILQEKNSLQEFYPPEMLQRLVSEPVFLRQTMLEIEAGLDPIEAIHLEKYISPVIAVELLEGLEDQDSERIHMFAARLKLSGACTRRLIQDDTYRSKSIDTLRGKINIWLADVDFTSYEAEAIAHLPADVHAHFFDKDNFIQQMALNTPDLKTLALLSTPGSIRFLERVLELKVSGDYNEFLRSYNLKYYTPHCRLYIDDHYAYVAKAAQFRDLEMVERYHKDDPRGSIMPIVSGAVEGKHLDLVKKYAPRAPPARLVPMLRRAITSGRLDIYSYLHNLCQVHLENCHYSELLIYAPNFEMFNLISSQIVDDERRLRAHRECTRMAVTCPDQRIFQFLESTSAVNVCSVINAAVFVPNLEILRKYLPTLKQEDMGARAADQLFTKSRSTEISQMLYNAGLRPGSTILFENVNTDRNDLEVLKFNLDHFDLDTLKTPACNDVFTILKYLLMQAAKNKNPAVLELVLDHPNIQKYDPYPVLIEIIFSIDDYVYLTGDRFYVGDITGCAPLEMLIHRGVKIDYIRGFRWATRTSTNTYHILRSLTNYMQRLGMRLTQEEYDELYTNPRSYHVRPYLDEVKP